MGRKKNHKKAEQKDFLETLEFSKFGVFSDSENIPKYAETTLFLTSFAFLLLVLTNNEMTNEIFMFVFNIFGSLRGIFLMAPFFIGLFSSLYYAVSDAKTPPFIKCCMLLFIIFTNLGVALAVGAYTLKGKFDFLAIFPFLNLAYAFWAMNLLMEKRITADSISVKNASPREILVGSISVLLLFAISQYILMNYWAVTFSICLVYSSMINEFMTKFFFME